MTEDVGKVAQGAGQEDILNQRAQQIVDLYEEDGFQIGDIFKTVELAMEAVKEFTALTGAQKEDAACDLLERVLVKVDLPGPDFITRRVIMFFARPLMKWLYERFEVGK